MRKSFWQPRDRRKRRGRSLVLWWIGDWRPAWISSRRLSPFIAGKVRWRRLRNGYCLSRPRPLLSNVFAMPSANCIPTTCRSVSRSLLKMGVQPISIGSANPWSEAHAGFCALVFLLHVCLAFGLGRLDSRSGLHCRVRTRMHAFPANKKAARSSRRLLPEYGWV